MNLPKREVKNILIGDDARNKIYVGAKKLYEVVSTTFGAAGNNVILGMPYGDSTVSRDGVTVAKRTILPDKAEDDAAVILRQASEKTNRSAGDGTTATIVLGYNLFKHGYRMAMAGDNGMILKKQITEDSKKVLDFIKSKAEDAADHLLEVATVSAGDVAIGALVADTLKEIGNEGGITIREQNYPTVDVEKVNGYYFDKGFFALNQQIEFQSPLIFVTQKQIASNADIIPLLSRVINGDNKNLIIIGEVRMNSDAMSTLMANLMQGKLNAAVIPPPAFNDEATLFMQDIALYVGARLFTQADDIQSVKTSDDFFGSAERVQISQEKAVLFRGAGDTQAIIDRAAEVREAMVNETNAHRKQTLEQRFAKLTGKIAIVNVGGSTQTEMEELRYRVEDAIEATKSAMAEGVTVGGATLLVKAANELDISKLYKDALLDTFRKLMTNAAEPADFRLEQVRRAKDGYGFNLRKMTDEPVDLRKEGIWDAARAVMQTVENATSAAGTLLTIGAIVDPIENNDEDQQN
jgi:chaperonin GroEL